MGWKTFVCQDSEYFRNMMGLGLKWGDLDIVSLNVDGNELIGSGVVSGTQTDYMRSLSVPVPLFTSLVRVKYGFYGSRGVSGRVVLGIQFFKGSAVVKDTVGRDVFGVVEQVVGSPTDMLETHVLNIQHSTGSITWWVDDLRDWSKPAKSFLTTVPDSFRVVIKVDEVSGGEVGGLVLELTTQQYDPVEDVYSVLFSIMSVLTVAEVLSLFRVSKHNITPVTRY